ncbi:hypothetical protein HN51_036961 [Arachis hypogaea]
MVLLCRRVSVIVVVLLVVLMMILGGGHGSRDTNVFKLKHKPEQQHGHFSGFLPKRMPIPYSTPSRKHNDIGLRTWTSP